MSENKQQINMLSELADMQRMQDSANPFVPDSQLLPKPLDSPEKLQLLEKLDKKSTDQIIDLAEMELQKSGITIYGSNGPINLTPLEHKFAVGYVKSGSVKEAMKFAGHKGKPGTAASLGYQLLNNPKVAEAVAVIEKQHVLASGLTELEVIAGIRDVVMLARQKNAFGPALKGYAMLGDYLEMWEKGAKGSGRNGKPASPAIVLNDAVFINNTGDQRDMLNDIKNLGKSLGIEIATTGVKPEILRDITAETILSEDDFEDNKL